MSIIEYKTKSTIFDLRDGFTLIELLVVISIIGILISLSFFGIQNARKSSRDAKRKSDLETVRSALEMYKADKGSYPSSSGSWVYVSDMGGSLGEYLSSIPVDPLVAQNESLKGNPACTRGVYGYYYRYGGTSGVGVTPAYGYHLIAGMEAQSQSNCPKWCGSSSAPSSCYTVTNP